VSEILSPHAPPAERAASRTRGLPYPSIPAVVFAVWGLVVPLMFGDRLLNADGDMLRHLRHGAWILEHGAFIHADPFSYTRGGDPFVSFEYGSQILYALAHQVGGLAGVAVLASLLIAASYAVLTRFLLSRGVDAFLTYLVSIAAAILGAVHWTARPHLFSLLGVMLLLHWLEPGERAPRAWWLAPIFLVWANLHGGFVFGLVLLGIYLAGSVLEWWLGGDRPFWAGRVKYYAEALAIAGLATLANPNGWELHLHIIRFFGEPFLRDNTHEFLSPDFHTAGGKMLLAALLGIITLLAVVPGRPTGPRLLLLLANVAFALQARRNIPLLAATVFPVLAIHFDAAWRRLPDWRGVRAVFERDARRGRDAPFIAAVALFLVALALLRGSVLGYQMIPARLDPHEFPVAAVQRARTVGVEGRIFHDFIWGGYILYAWPEQRVFIDGGTDFYGPGLMSTYMDVSGLQPGWRDTLAARDIGLVLMPTRSPLVNELAQDGWQVRYCDPTAALLQLDSTRIDPRGARSAIAGCADTAVVDRLGE
jgi:hypothetical protein